MFHKILINTWRVIALSVVIFGASCKSINTVIKVESPSSTVQVNDTIKVPVKVENIANLTAIEIHLSFNSNVLEVVSLNNGGFVTADFPVQNTFDNTVGTIDYAVAQINHPAAQGSGTLLEIVFRAKAGGDSLINFRSTQATPEGAILSDANGKEIQVSLNNGSVAVK
jgi:hypothetical protein